MITQMNNSEELKEALSILRLAPRLEQVSKRFERAADEKFDGINNYKALLKKRVLSKIQKQNTKKQSS